MAKKQRQFRVIISMYSRMDVEASNPTEARQAAEKEWDKAIRDAKRQRLDISGFESEYRGEWIDGQLVKGSTE